MTAAMKSLHLLVGQLRAFAAVTTRSPAGSDEIVLEVLTDFEAVGAADPVVVFGDLYRRLQRRPDPVATSRRPASPETEGDWRYFEQLRDGQRSAVFLVIGLEFSIEDAARVLGEPEDWVILEVMSAMFCMEHVFPARLPPRLEATAPIAGRGHAPVRSFAPPAALRPAVMARRHRPFRHGLPAS